MSDSFCTYQGTRDEMLVAYLYGDLEPAERAAFESHTAACAMCRTELAELRAVRTELGRWAPPEPSAVFTYAMPGPPSRSRVWTMLREVPAWAQVAAALLIFGVSAGIANLEVTYDREGVSVRTGWSAFVTSDNVAPAGQVRTPASSGASAASGGQVAVPAATDAPWRRELAVLEQQLRREFQAADLGGASARRTAPQATARDADILRRVRELIEESERRQRSELALRVASVAREVQAQRLADLQKIQYSLGVIENTTGVAMMRQRQLLDNLAVRVSQRP